MTEDAAPPVDPPTTEPPAEPAKTEPAPPAVDRVEQLEHRMDAVEGRIDELAADVAGPEPTTIEPRTEEPAAEESKPAEPVAETKAERHSGVLF